MGSEPGRRVLECLDNEREANVDGTEDRVRIDHAYFHTLAFAVYNVPPGLNDEAIDAALAQAFLTVKTESIGSYHIEIATRAFIDLYPDGTPTYTGRHPNGMEDTILGPGHSGDEYCKPFQRPVSRSCEEGT